MTSLEELRDINARCIHCRACQYAYADEPDREGETEDYTGMMLSCPGGNFYGWEGYYNSGKMWMARAYLEGDLEPSQEMLEIMEACTTCGLCGEQCENYIDTVDVIEELRAAIIEDGVEPLKRHKVINDRVLEEDKRNPYNEAREERIAWYDGEVDFKDAEVAYYVGCTGAYRQQDIAKHTASILEKLGINFTVLSDEVCCGSPILRTGQKDTFKKVMNENLGMFKDFDLVAFSCAGCYRTFRVDYPKQSGEPLPFKVAHTLDIVHDMIQDGELEIETPYNKKVTWHDPCHTIRHIGLDIEKRVLDESDNWLIDSRKAAKAKEAWYERPREVLRAIPGIDFREMYRIKGDSFCCGAGGGVKTQFPEMALATAKERVKEAASTGADVLMTSCPFCITNFQDAIKALREEEEETGEDLSAIGSKLEVVELLELMDRLI
ncbi:MAG: 4Fe-4S dicluster domain-containing protein [Candidatus Thorarchaeota archaeon]|nr:4Fe-4S dicluster domain-containing protein [Candidatus Thorarchaeota archaeon]